MAATVISKADALKARRSETVEEQLEYRINGESKHVSKKIVKGELETFEITKPIGELLTTPAGLDALVQKTVLDIEEGREQQPLLYQPLYRRRENRRFTKTVQVGAAGTRAHTVFLEHIEGEEVKFGTRTLGAADSVPILTYASGFQWTEDMEEFDLTWEAEEAQRALGEAYNALLNHLHFYPLISYSYGAGNIQTYNPQALTGTQYEKDRSTLEAALQKAALLKNPVTGRNLAPSIAVTHSSNRFRLQAMLERRQIGGTIYEPIGQQINTIILYDGWSDTVGEKTYDYAGCSTTKVLLVEPQRYLHELVKHDLIVDADNADISRLIRQQVVARARRGVYAVPANSVMVMNLT
jgi:hypothetical protein